MGIRSKVRYKLLRLLEKLTNTHIYDISPHGVSVYEDIKRVLPRFSMEVVFDVGANIGQSAQEYLKRYPRARIFCFEPVRANFDELRQNLQGSDRVHCFDFALGAQSGSGNMVVRGLATMFHLEDADQEKQSYAPEELEATTIETLDSFCAKHSIEKINYLKVDTEGYDLEVLKGSSQMLKQGRIDLVEVEGGMNPGNTHHVRFESLKDFLEKHQYFLFGIYEQVYEWPTEEPHLRRTNAVYVSKDVIAAYRGLIG